MYRVRPSVLLLLAVGACSGSGSLQQNEETSAVLVSAPIPRSALSDNPEAAGTVGFVSAVPGAVQGDRVVVRNRHTGEVLTIAVDSGGFDPVAIGGAAGDTLSIVVSGLSDLTETIKRETAPRVVRTEPTASRTDVPLNSIIMIVFSAPISLPTAASGIHVEAGGSPVQGTIVTDVSNPAIIDFEPQSPLQPGTVYRVEIDASVEDLVGNSLDSATAIQFTTGSAQSTGFVPPDQMHGFIWGFVVDSAGNCIAGASVEVLNGPATGRSADEVLPCDFWDYDQMGGYALRNLPEGMLLTLRASAPGYQSQEQQWGATNGGPERDFVLAPE